MLSYTTLYAVFNNMDELIASLEKSWKDLLKRFVDNHMKSNPDKFHLLLSSCEKIKMETGDFEIENSTWEKLSGIHFDSRLTFDHHISELCKKVGKRLMHKQESVNKLNSLRRQIFMNTFFWFKVQVLSTHVNLS